MNKIYETLTDDVKLKIDNIVQNVTDAVTVDKSIDLVLLMSVLEQLNETKKNFKEELKEAAKEKTEAIRLRAEIEGRRYIETLPKGAPVTFRYGTGGKQTATLPLEKVGDKTIQVTYPEEMLPEGSRTAKRNIRFDKIVVPEEFLATLVA